MKTQASLKWMKSSFVLILVLTLISCLNEPHKVYPKTAQEIKSPIKIKPPGPYYVEFDKQECKDQIAQAKRDIENDQLIFLDPAGWTIIRYDEEMADVLKNFNIDYEITGPNCTLELECYGYHMDSIIHNMHGANFINEVRQKADSLFLSKWRTKVYEYWDIDQSPIYSEYSTEEFFEREIQFPIGWDTVPIKYQRQYLTVEITISNEGVVENWKHDEMSNIKKSNEQFVPDLQRQIGNIISRMKVWKPGILNGKNVSSMVLVDIDLDKE